MYSKKSPEHVRWAGDRNNGVIRLKKDSALYKENVQNSRKSCAFDVLTKEQALAIFGEKFTIIAKSVTNWDARAVEGTFHIGMESAPVGAPASLDPTGFNMSRLWKSPDKGSRAGEGTYYTFITWGPPLSQRNDFLYNLPAYRSATLDHAPSRSSLNKSDQDLPGIVPAEVKLSTLSGAAIAFTGKSRGTSRKQLGLLAIEHRATKIIDTATKEMTLLVILGNVNGDAKPSAKERVARVNRIPVMLGEDFIALVKPRTAPGKATSPATSPGNAKKSVPAPKKSSNRVSGVQSMDDTKPSTASTSTNVPPSDANKSVPVEKLGPMSKAGAAANTSASKSPGAAANNTSTKKRLLSNNQVPNTSVSSVSKSEHQSKKKKTQASLNTFFAKKK